MFRRGAVVGIVIVARERLEQVRVDGAGRRGAGCGPPPSIGEQLVGIVGPGRTRPFPDQGLPVAQHRVLVGLGWLVAVGRGRRGVLGDRSLAVVLAPRGELGEELAGSLGVDVLAVPGGGADPERPPCARERHVHRAALLDHFLRLQIALEMRQGAVERGQHGRVAPQLEVQRIAALGRVLLDALGGHQPAGHAGHEDVVELQPLRLVDRHDLDRVVVAGLHGLPFLLVELLDRVHVVQERA